MIWTFTSWFIFAVILTSSKTFSENILDDWPYTVKKHEHSEQSPVDISTDYAQRRFLPFLRYFGYWAFDKAIMDITNNGHTVCVKLANHTKDVPFIMGGPLFDSRYEFEEMHFHWGKHDYGSEHEVNGFRYGMEVHIVHFKKEYGTFKNAQSYIDGVCVVGFFGQVSPRDNREMTNFITDLRHIVKPKTHITRSFKDMFSWLKSTALKQHYYTYHGSLTTPPYTECVTWIIFTKPIPISKRQLREFRKLQSSHFGMLINENDRELQPFNNRTIIYGY